MPSIISHAVVASSFAWASLAFISEPTDNQHNSLCRSSIPLLITTGILAMLPDADSLGYALGVPYESVFGHRGVTHSLAFAVIIGMVVGLLLHRRYSSISNLHKQLYSTRRCIVLCVFALCSHGILDGFTTGGLGVAYFAPWSAERHFFDYRFIRVSPISVKAFFSSWGLRVIASEILWLVLPSILLVLSSNLIRSIHSKKRFHNLS